jgi:trehalose/maltose hydrolase-like predicted phosphorylase
VSVTDEPLERTFEALVFDWDGTAVPDRQADASLVQDRLVALLDLGVDVAIVSGTHVGNVDGQLRARPTGPGHLWMCLNRGSEVFEVDASGPHLVNRREATASENELLDAAATRTVEHLEQHGISARIVSRRLNRRKVDIIPEPEWDDPPKARIGELLAAVKQRLWSAQLGGLQQVVQLALGAAEEVGLPNARVTSDVKHVEIGLTDKSDSMRWVLDELDQRGIGPGLVLLAGDEFGSLGGVIGSDALMLVSPRIVSISVGVEPEGCHPDVLHLGGGPAEFLRLLERQIARRRARRVPSIDLDPGFTLQNPHTLGSRAEETLFTLADGRIATRGLLEEAAPEASSAVLASGTYVGEDAGQWPRLQSLPHWFGMDAAGHDAKMGSVRTLDLRTGVLLREVDGVARTLRFSSLGRPGVAAMRAEWTQGAPFFGGDARLPPLDPVTADGGKLVRAHAVQRLSKDGDWTCLERAAAFDGATESADLAALDFDHLLAQQRKTWALRWRHADVSISGDEQLTRDVRFALFHLMQTVAESGEAAVGARGLSGPAYGGHVFWDADVFVLPFFAATHPAAARAMLEYRIRRLGAARDAARELGLHGARFPWESSQSGRDVTPRVVYGPLGEERIHTGEREEHVVADVAWAADCYVRWSGDTSFEQNEGRELFIETARYWASRIAADAAGGGHIRGVIGPDEYHELVDDNAFTNVMARWNLRRAARAIRGGPLDSNLQEEATRFEQLADRLVDGFDAATGLYEQFSGFFQLEPLIISTLARPPIAADLLLGRERTQRAQVIKQADVLMLHHMVPEELHPSSLAENLRFYLPRTAHGSSLSPAIHAGLIARGGDPDGALELLRLAARMDLDDLTRTTLDGLHFATMGGLWQAIAFGFLGLRMTDDALVLEPRLPKSWSHVRIHLQVRGVGVVIEASPGELAVGAEGRLAIRLEREVHLVDHSVGRFGKRELGWERKS